MISKACRMTLVGVAGVSLLLVSESIDVHGSVSRGSAPGVGVRAADFNMYGVNNAWGLLHQSADSPGNEQAHALVRQAGIGWVRYWLSWDIVQQHGPDYWNWQFADNDIDAAINQGLNVYVTLRSAPRWSTSPTLENATGKGTYQWGHCGGESGVFSPTPDGCGPAGSLNAYRPFDPGAGSGQSFYWKRFVTEAVKRYGDRVKYWGFWNEPTGQWHWPEYAEVGCATPKYSRLKQLVDKVIVPGRQAALTANPSVRIVGPDDYDEDSLAFFLQLERDGGCSSPAYGQFFDVISHHIYGIPANMGRLHALRATLASFPRREFWMTETDGSYLIGDQLALVIPRGWISKVFVYGMMSTGPADCDFLISHAKQPCPQWTTYANHIAANKPSVHFAGTTAVAGHHDFLLMQNPHSSATTATVRFSTATGTTKTLNYNVPALSRYSIYLPNQGYANVEQAVTVQSGDASRPLWAEHADYWNNFQAGRLSQGTGERSDTWYFAEGVVGSGFWVHDNTAYNPSAFDVRVTWTFLGPSGTNPVSVVRDLPPFGSSRVRVNDVPGIQPEQSTKVSAIYLNGIAPFEPAPIVAERTVSWGTDSEGHSTRGVPFPSTEWYFAEGSKASGWSTFLLLLNPNPVAATVNVQYMQETGLSGVYSYTLSPNSRLTIDPPVPGPFGISVKSVGANPTPIVAERSMYSGLNWTVGHATEGAPVTSQRWMFAEGSTEGGRFYDSYILLANPSNATAQVRLNFRLPSGAVTSSVVMVPPGQRRTVAAWDYPALQNQPFSTEVVVESIGGAVPPGIVAERSMYWSGVSGSSTWFSAHATMGMP